MVEMEKLIVKNFGPIKQAEIELAKYVLFIGDTSTGKSVLAKLILIFRDFANILKNDVTHFDHEKELNLKVELQKYNIDFDIEDSVFEYYDKFLKLKIVEGKIDLIEDNYIKVKVQDLVTEGTYSKDELRKIFLQIGVKGKAVYFPPERILTSIIGSSIFGLLANDVALPNCFKYFAAKYETARKHKINKSFEDFGFDYSFENNEEQIQKANHKFQLKKASSGIQSLLPLLLVFDYELDNEFSHPDYSFLIEEPELNLYPIKQKKLVDYFVKKIQNTHHKLIITTHSPYIISSVDTLILAKNTFNEHPDLKEEISSIIPESNWINYDEICVYEVRDDGKVYSIKNDDFKSIDTNIIDSVSDIISEEFNKLTDLRYAH